MCKAMEEHDLKTKVLAYIDAYRSLNKEDAEVVELIVKRLGIAKEYVERLMQPVPA